MQQTFLQHGNSALCDENYALAAKMYRMGWVVHPELGHIFDSNIRLAERRCGRGGATETLGPDIDVVMPVHNALEYVQNAVVAVAKNVAPLDLRVTLLNDASDVATSSWLIDWCAQNPMFRLIEFEENIGYTRSVNVGLRAATADYIVALNSDTVVAEGWLGGLLRCINSRPNIAIAGPISNAAGWQSVPRVLDAAGRFVVNSLPHGWSVARMADVIMARAKRIYPAVPLVNGFCFMIRRRLIEEVGVMDETNFPHGYGEESDYCVRARDAGFECAIADDVFVYHAKSKSFGEERRAALTRAGLAALQRKHTSQKYFSLIEQLKNNEVLETLRRDIGELYQ